MLQRSSPLPLYQQLTQLLAQRIERGDWKPGDLIPGEHELQELYQLSRTTVRQAVQDLERAGLVTRHRGRGTFVAEPRTTYRVGVSESLLRQGIQPGWRVLVAEPRSATPVVAARLQISPGAPVFYSLRLRLADTCPIGQLEAHVPAGLTGELDLDLLAVGGSLDYLRARGLLRRSRTTRTLTAAAADALAAARLDITIGAPVLHILRLVNGADGRPVEDCCATYRGDRFRLHTPDNHEP
jgi:GntR family transcriptional regulator